MKLDKAIEAIKKFEGCRLEAYQDVGGIWTIGYGHTNRVQKGDVITQDQADAYLAEDVAVHASRVEKYQKIYNFTENEYNALVSFAYNVGNIDSLTLNGTRTKQQILQHIGDFCYSRGRRIDGLATRRWLEAQLFAKKDDSTTESELKENPTISYKVGNVYELQANVIVRATPSIKGKKVGYAGLTADGKKHDPDKNGSLNKGTKVTCKDVKVVNGNIWIKCPSGWLAATYNGEVLIR